MLFQVEQSNVNYVVSTLAVSWKDAFVLCEQSGMELVSITSAKEQNAVAEALSSYPPQHGFSKGYWTSGTRFNGNSFVWFTSGKPLVYNQFADNQPDNAGNNENLGQSNFKYVISTVAVPWKDAFVLCKQSGMELVSITSAEEQNAVADALSAYPTKQGFSNGYWTSGTRFNGNSFVWFTSGKPLVYTRFADKQPDNAGNNENCIEFFMYCENSYKWNDRDCSQKAGYICQERSD
ncbi:lectin subunit alpha isoform X2 [Dendroctonus ponderosae]|uniref:C-type lectin domain-containing protein n=1 Tax=Dendroctonus ponderosae TaxID=77166 RepID=A0AAR5PJP0_DENPD|nr:lectin subunit alpha isoform X2 [Dendroctonus ponderosae]